MSTPDPETTSHPEGSLSEQPQGGSASRTRRPETSQERLAESWAVMRPKLGKLPPEAEQGLYEDLGRQAENPNEYVAGVDEWVSQGWGWRRKRKLIRHILAHSKFLEDVIAVVHREENVKKDWMLTFAIDPYDNVTYI